METKLCRICGKLGQNYVHIFRSEGLKNRIETCLPIVVSPHSLLPDTICGECNDQVDNSYSFIKNCLQNIIILEAQYDITESCLRTKRKHDKSCMVDLTPRKESVQVQTEDYLDVLLKESTDICLDFELQAKRVLGGQRTTKLVDYEIDSDSSDEESKPFSLRKPNSKLLSALTGMSSSTKRYFSDTENYLIDEISQRKKRKIEVTVPATKSSSRRKSKPPVKVEAVDQPQSLPQQDIVSFSVLEKLYEETFNTQCQSPSAEVVFPLPPPLTPAPCLVNTNGIHTSTPASVPPPLPPPQVCLLCDQEFTGGPSIIAAHVYETHGIDMAQVVANVATTENYNGNVNCQNSVSGSGDKKKKLPNLLKISDLKKSEGDDQPMEVQPSEDPPTLLPSFVCSLCPAMFTARPDLFTHFRVKHPDQAGLLCGMCLHRATSVANLETHVEQCGQHHQPTTRFVCQICRYGDDSSKSLENHVLVHDFLVENCKKLAKMYDPADYIETVHSFSPNQKNLTCSECGHADFDNFKDFSTHRRSQHSIFHCDLCNKFYGRNSHLWKHVNRLHKGHPSITCQLCFKTSASKYHLGQHFNKIHNSSKPMKNKTEASSLAGDHNNDSTDDFMSQKFQGFDFQSVKQSFMRQELLEKTKAASLDLDDDNTNEDFKPPKEIDASSDLYTNIITNYTPPTNEGEFKCPKCGKGFFKKTLLKKHKKNCRPRLQKDLLTRCKTCSRVFKDRQSLAKHLVNYHHQYDCEICQQRVTSKCEIVSHIRFGHPGCHLFCQICGNILRSAKDLVEHVQDHANSYVCQFCGDPLPSKIKLKMHILSLHRKILSLSCGVCLKLFESQHVLRDHVKLVHRDKLAPLTSCPVCGKNYGSKWKTYDHLNKSHGRIFKACKVCLEVFDTDEQLTVHGDTHSSQKVAAGLQMNDQKVMHQHQQQQQQFQVQQPQQQQQQPQMSDSDNNNSSDSSDPELDFGSGGGGQPPQKISLLEKRLLGVKGEMTPNKSQSGKVKMSSPVDPQQNSSKRTVYVNSNDPSLCEICMKTWPAKKHLWQHYIRCHKEVAATVCGICLKTNDSYVSLQAHLKHNHPNLLHGQGFGSNFICRICGRYHNASSKLRLHMAIHDGFDWTLLQTPQLIDDNKSNGFKTEDNSQDDVGDDDNNINYDSLIEQVETSDDSEDTINVSGDEDEDDDDEDGEEDTSSDRASDSDDSDEAESSSSSGNSKPIDSMEAQMLKNMLNENGDVKEEFDEVGEDDDDEEDDGGEALDDNDEDSSQSWSGYPGEIKEEDETQLVEDHAEIDDDETQIEELDSAIQSIKYEECKIEEIVSHDDDNDEMIEDFVEEEEIPLNDNEIDAAVGSIL